LLVLALVSQGNPSQSPTAPWNCVSDSDQQRLSVETGIEKRIKIRKEISDRFHKTVERVQKMQQPDAVAALLACWSDHLAASLKDVESYVNRKKRSGALKNFEIELRKSIRFMEDSRLKASYQESAQYDAWLDQAKKVREKFVDILFQR
jgi:hypothetical protein